MVINMMEIHPAIMEECTSMARQMDELIVGQLDGLMDGLNPFIYSVKLLMWSRD